MSPPLNRCAAPACPYLARSRLCPEHNKIRQQLVEERLEQLNQPEGEQQ